MNYYFVDKPVGLGKSLELPEEERHHALQVMRQTVGSSIGLLDGKGGKGNGFITEASKKTCLVQVTNWETEAPPLARTIIAVAPPKSADRLDFMLEKLTECGADEIIFLETARTERNRIREDRVFKVCLSALKQCKRSYLPVFRTSGLNDIYQLNISEKYILSLQQGAQSISDTLQSSNQDRIFLIGPEGDFTTEEYQLAAAAGFKPIFIPSSVLRTETAALWACIASKMAG